MKVLTITGEESTGKSTFLICGLAQMLNGLRTKSETKPRVMLVSDTMHTASRLRRMLVEQCELAGFTGCSTGEHSNFELSEASHSTLKDLDRRFDYVAVDASRWPEREHWLCRNRAHIGYLIVVDTPRRTVAAPISTQTK